MNLFENCPDKVFRHLVAKQFQRVRHNLDGVTLEHYDSLGRPLGSLSIDLRLGVFSIAEIDPETVQMLNFCFVKLDRPLGRRLISVAKRFGADALRRHAVRVLQSRVKEAIVNRSQK